MRTAVDRALGHGALPRHWHAAGEEEEGRGGPGGSGRRASIARPATSALSTPQALPRSCARVPALEQVTRKVLDAYTVRTRVRVHAYGYTFIARYAHDSTVTVRGSSVHLAVAMAFAPPASKHASRVANVGHFHHILPLIEGSPTPRHRRRRATWANQMGLMGHVASVR